MLRRPEAAFRPQFWAEGGPIFYAPTFFHDPGSLLLSPYAGYLHLVPRLIAHIERLVEPSIAPVVGSLISYAVVALIAAFIAGSRLAVALPSRWIRLSLACMLLVSPSVYEILAVEVNLQVYLAVYLAVLAIAAPPARGIHQWKDAAGAVAAGLSGPFSLLLAPVFWLRRGWLVIPVTVCGAIQLAVILVSPQRPIEIPDAGVVVDVVLLRTTAAYLGPTLGSWAHPTIGLLLILATAFIAIRAPYRRAWMTVGYGAMVIAGAGIASDGGALAQHARDGERFFLLASLAVALLVACGVTAKHRATAVASQALAVALLAGVVVDFRVPAFPDSNWREASTCIGAAAPCVVPMQPPAFTFVWPGDAGSYPVPVTRPTDP